MQEQRTTHAQREFEISRSERQVSGLDDRVDISRRPSKRVHQFVLELPWLLRSSAAHAAER